MGAAGDMLMAALLELDGCAREFVEIMNSLGLPDVRVGVEPSVKRGIAGTRVTVEIGGEEEGSGRTGRTSRTGRAGRTGHGDANAGDIESIINGLPVSDDVKKNALAVYGLLADAESHVHGEPVSQIHFHEIGELDAIADIVGTCLLIERLAPERVLASPVRTGYGEVRCAHGTLPVPAPATAHILRNVPVYAGDIRGELCTPTGAALLARFAEDFTPMPPFKIEKIGYGMGKKDFEAPNCVRAFLGETGGLRAAPDGEAAELRCNVDDMTGEQIGFCVRELFGSGALDVFTTPAQMKKDRPGAMITCVCDAARADFFAALILKHTTTFGVRKNICERYTLAREVAPAETPFGPVAVKKGSGYGVCKTKLEYDDVARIASEKKLSYGEAERMIRDHLRDSGALFVGRPAEGEIK